MTAGRRLTSVYFSHPGRLNDLTRGLIAYMSRRRQTIGPLFPLEDWLTRTFQSLQSPATDKHAAVKQNSLTILYQVSAHTCRVLTGHW